MNTFVLLIALFMPIYSKYFSQREFKFLFSFNQIIYIICSFLHLIISKRWHVRLGLPSWILYGFVGNFLETLEKILTVIPVNVIISELTPQGIESSMLCLASTLYNINF
jgi:hypothetical protein